MFFFFLLYWPHKVFVRPVPGESRNKTKQTQSLDGSYRVLKCDVIKFSFFAFQHFHDNIQ